MQTITLNTKSIRSNHGLLIGILTFGVFAILSTELGAMGIIPIFKAILAYLLLMRVGR